jgi:hypothetical protein
MPCTFITAAYCGDRHASMKARKRSRTSPLRDTLTLVYTSYACGYSLCCYATNLRPSHSVGLTPVPAYSVKVCRADIGQWSIRGERHERVRDSKVSKRPKELTRLPALSPQIVRSAHPCSLAWAGVWLLCWPRPRMTIAQR